MYAGPFSAATKASNPLNIAESGVDYTLEALSQNLIVLFRCHSFLQALYVPREIESSDFIGNGYYNLADTFRFTLISSYTSFQLNSSAGEQI